MVSRRTVGIDAELIDKLKEVAKNRGVTLSNYLRMLISEALAIESLGHYAPRALREKRIELVLENLGFIFVPKELISTYEGSVEGIGERVGAVVKELGIEPLEVVELLSRFVSSKVSDSNRLILIKPPGNGESVIIDLIRGLAQSLNLEVEVSGGMVVIKIPREVIAKQLIEFRERGRRRRPKS